MQTSRLTAFPAFAELRPAELEAVAEVVREVAYEAGFPVVTADDYGTAVYFVEYGEVVVTAEGEEGGATLGRGEMFGEIGLLLTGERTATVTARTPVKLLVLSGIDFERIRSEVPELERSLRRVGLERASR